MTGRAHTHTNEEMDKTDLLVLIGLTLVVVLYLKRETIKSFISELLFAEEDSATTVSTSSRDIAEVVNEHGKNYVVFYASQTGTAEDYAKKFAKELTAKFGLNVMCADVEYFDFETLNDLPDGCVVSFFVSTYGEGDFPDGAVHLEDFLSNCGTTDLENVNFTIFGLGNCTYEFFNGASRKCNKYLLEAGAKQIGAAGEGDDGSGSTDEDYLAWKDAILEELKSKLKLDERQEKFVPSFKLETLETVTEKTSLGEPSLQYLPANKLSFNDEGVQLGPFDLSQPYVAPVAKSYELFKSGDRNCIHSEIDVSGSNIKYTTGDHLAIWPSNANEKVEQFLQLFNLKGDTIFNLKPQDSTIKVPFPCPTTIEATVRHYLEITGPVSRQSFGSLIQFAPNEEIKQKLTALAKDKDLFAKEITAKCYNLADALLYVSNGQPWSTVPWEFLIEAMAHIQPRYYSISSSSLSEKQTIHITSVVENSPNPVDPSLPPVVGVATNLLRNVQLAKNNEDTSSMPVHYDLNGPRNLFQGYKLPVHVRRSTFRLPTNPSTPVIMIGPGTGVAPFRGFVRERVKFVEQQENVQLGKHLLFYGSRNTDDYLYREEWPEYAKKLGASFEMIVGHSRIPGQPKVYVQDKIREHAQEVLKLIHEGAFLYICGDAKNMAQGVNAALVDILSEDKKITKEEASEMIKMLKTTGRFQEDVW